MTDAASIKGQEFPPKPREPDISECCQRNCVNCVFVYYQRAMDRWKKKVDDIKAGNS